MTDDERFDRAGFEAWAAGRYLLLRRYPNVPQEYSNHMTDIAWQAWKAALRSTE